MNDAERPRRALGPQGEPSPAHAADGADEAEQTVVRKQKFSYDDLLYRRPPSQGGMDPWPSGERPRPEQVAPGTALGRSKTAPKGDASAAKPSAAESTSSATKAKSSAAESKAQAADAKADVDALVAPESAKTADAVSARTASATRSPAPDAATQRPSDRPATAASAAVPSGDWFRPEPKTTPAPKAGDGGGNTPVDPPAHALGKEPDESSDKAVPDEANTGRLRRSLLLTLASAVVPGSGLLGAPQRGLKVLGAVTTAMFVLAIGYLGISALTDLSKLTQAAQRESTLTQATFGLVIVAVVSVALIALTHIATRPEHTTQGRRILGAVVVTALAFAVAAPTAVAARYSRDAYLMLDQILPQASDIKASNREEIAASNAPDPWADTERVNILLLGADGNEARKENVEMFGVRTDTIMVASIDTKTGNTTLIQIPRNVQYTPFPEGSVMAEEFPDGLRGEGGEGEWFVNTIWEKTSEGGDYAHLFEGTTFPGAEALKEGVQGITGLKIDRFAMLNIDGLSNLINAMGGVTVNVNNRLPIGGNKSKGIRPSGYIEVGKEQKLDGYHAMWYARSRYDSSDYDRMARQSCLVDAIINQANPETLVTSFEPIAAASADMVSTDITRDEFGAFIDLAFRVKDGGTVNRLVFAPGKNGYSYADPDFEAMREAVQTAIGNPAKSTASPAPPSAAPTSSPTASEASAEPKETQSSEPEETESEEPEETESTKATPTTDEQKLTDGSQNVGDACAWQGN